MKDTPAVILSLLLLVASCRAAEPAGGASNPTVGSDEEKTLLAIARSSLTWCIEGKTNAFAFDKFILTPKLREPIATS